MVDICTRDHGTHLVARMVTITIEAVHLNGATEVVETGIGDLCLFPTAIQSIRIMAVKKTGKEKLPDE
jgi:hypothetical protein